MDRLNTSAAVASQYLSGKASLHGLLAAFLVSIVIAPAQGAEPIVATNCSIAALLTAKVASDRPGVLEEVRCEEGDQVQAGETIANLRDDVTSALVDIARKQTENDIDIRLAEKTSEVAAAEYEQAVNANANPNLQVVTRYELRRLKLSAEQTELQIEQARHEFDVKKLELVEAEERLKEHLIVSPITGMVVRRYRMSGESVQQGSEIIEIVDFETLKIEGFIDLADSWNLKPGDPVVVRLESPNLPSSVREKTFNGKIRFIDGAVTPVTERVRVWAEVKNEAGFLKPGLRATMEISSPDNRSATP